MNPAANGWTVVRDSYYISPYAFKGNQWIGFDDPLSLQIKVTYSLRFQLTV